MVQNDYYAEIKRKAEKAAIAETAKDRSGKQLSGKTLFDTVGLPYLG